MRTTRPPSCSLAAASLTAVASTTHRPLRLLPTPVGGPRHRCTLAYRCAHMHITYAYVWSASAHALHSSALPIVHTCLIVHTAHTITCRHAYAYTYMPKTTRHAYVALVAYGARGVGRTCGDQHLPRICKARHPAAHMQATARTRTPSHRQRHGGVDASRSGAGSGSILGGLVRKLSLGVSVVLLSNC